MTSISHPGSLLGLPARIGQICAAPQAAMARIDAQGGGLRDALWLILFGVVAFRLPELLRTLLAIGGPTSGAALRLLGLFSEEAREAAWVVLPAAVIVTASAGGRRRDATRDLDLGAACYAPYFALRGIVQALAGVAGARVLQDAVVEGIAGAGAAFVLIFAIRTARARLSTSSDPPANSDPPASSVPSPSPEPPPVSMPNARARLAGTAIALVALIALTANAVWAARHLEALRPMQRGEPAPEFALPRIDATAGTLTMASLRGQVVVLDFWATWCPPCIAMLPVLDAAHRTWAAQGVAFVGINSDGGGATLDEVKGFLIEHPIPYPIVLDGGFVGGLYKVEALPTLVVVGRDGRIRKSFVGYTSARTLDGALREAATP